MPRKRKKLESRLSSDRAFPYKKYRIEWIDPCGETGWADKSEFDKMTIASPTSEAWIYSKDKKFIKFFATYDKDENGNLTFGDRNIIPIGCVKRLTKLSN